MFLFIIGLLFALCAIGGVPPGFSCFGGSNVGVIAGSHG